MDYASGSDFQFDRPLMQKRPVIGVVIVTYGSAPVISDCLTSLLDSQDAELRIIVCDNASVDDTVPTIRQWADTSGHALTEVSFEQSQDLKFSGLAPVTLVHVGQNRGFAGGVNTGLRILHSMPEVDLFWIVNPDVIAFPTSAADFARTAQENPGFGLMGGRVVYADPPNLIQSDAGVIHPYTGVCRSLNQGRAPGDTDRPLAAEASFISGANMIASRAFIDRVGYMREDYFLFFEEVDWALRRGDLSLVICPNSTVQHHGGTAIGSGTIQRRASGFANYFNYRNRVWLMKRFHPWRLPVVYAESSARILKLLLGRAWSEAWGAFCGLYGLAPPRAVAQRVGPDAAPLAFGRMSKD